MYLFLTLDNCFACSLRDQYVFTIGQTQYIKGDPLTLHLITSNEAQCI